MLSGRTLQISLSLCLLCFFTPWYWSSMKGREGAHLQLNLILHRQKSKIVHVKKESQGTFFFFFVGDQNFSHYVTKEYNSAGATLANPKGKASDSSSYPKLIKETTKSILGLQLKFCAWIKISDRYCGKNTKALSTTATQQRMIKAAN